MASFGVKFWGTRGLISSPRQDTAIFGGNTTCVQILHENHLILVDSGFGIANFGEQLLSRIVAQGEALKVHIFYTHFHWDHIQGLPFFKPIYFESTELHLYSPQSQEDTLGSLNILFDGSYSPFESLMKMQAQVFLHQLAGPLERGGLTVSYQEVDHGDTEKPALTSDSPHVAYAYKFTKNEDESICVITDHEARPGKKHDAVTAFAKGTSLLIHDGQFLPAEYQEHQGWGHSSTTQALNHALRIGAGKVLLTHHDPSRSDTDLMREHRCLMQNINYHNLDFEFAREEVNYVVAAQMHKPLKVG